MPFYICQTCGTQFPESETPPDHCTICEEERQYVGVLGQSWTTLEQLEKTHRNSYRKKEHSLMAIGTEPSFGIGQRALLIMRPEGNLLWDCISLLDNATVDFIESMGGLSAIAISHPHYYTTMVEWSKVFGDIPVYLHEADRQWVMRSNDNIHFWSGETKELGDDITLIRCGGHFDGGTVLHWADGDDGKGALLTGDIIQVVPDRKHVSFMYSYPNLIPLPEHKVQHIVDTVEPFKYDRIYGAWWDRNIISNAKEVVHVSAERYISAINE
jgi:hypothetical protein